MKSIKLTPFEIRVYRQVRTIPWGETRSYKWVARRLGSPNSARAVGQALRRNPFPLIVPCHRVVRKDGAIGGFSGGKRLKKRLLELEKAAEKTYICKHLGTESGAHKLLDQILGPISSRDIYTGLCVSILTSRFH